MNKIKIIISLINIFKSCNVHEIWRHYSLIRYLILSFECIYSQNLVEWNFTQDFKRHVKMNWHDINPRNDLFSFISYENCESMFVNFFVSCWAYWLLDFCQSASDLLSMMYYILLFRWRWLQSEPIQNKWINEDNCQYLSIIWVLSPNSSLLHQR